MGLLRRVFATEGSRRRILNCFPGRSWWSIEGKARSIGLKRPGRMPISKTLHRQVDIGFSAGMLIADGAVMEKLIASNSKRARFDGGGDRKRRWYSVSIVQVGMEDRESLKLLAKMWGAKVHFDKKSSVGNDVWRVCITGRKACDLLRLILPHLAGPKRNKALYILKKYNLRTSLPVVDPEHFKSFEGLK